MMPQVVHLMTSDKKPIQITTTQVERWFARLEEAHSTKRTQLLSRFGLKNAQDVITFLNSPEGKSIIAIIGERLANMEAMNDAIHEQQNLSRRQHRHLILLLLGLMYNHKARSEKLNRGIQEQIDKKLHQHELDAQAADYDHTVYNETAQALEDILTSTLKDAEQLELELIALPEELLEIESRYQIYNKWLTIESIEELSLNPERIDAEMKEIELQLSSYAVILSALITEHKNTEAHETQTLTHALNLKSNLLNTMKIAHQQEKRLFNSKAEPVQSFAQADFIIPKDKTLTFEANQYYLHPKSTDFSKFSPQQRKEALDAYQLSRYDIMSIRMQVQLNRTQELALHASKKASLLARSEAMQQNIHLLTKQLSKVRQIEQQPVNANTPRPTPMLKKPELQHDPLKNIIHQSRLHIERLMSGQQPTILAKKRMDEIALLDELKLRADSPTSKPSITPRRG